MAAKIFNGAITAIRDMNQEGFIAATLTRAGWSVLYRATSQKSLVEKSIEYPDALVIQSDDFAYEDAISHPGTLLIRGKSHPVGVKSQHHPNSEFELIELIRNLAQGVQSPTPHIAATQSRVIALSSIGRGVGTSTSSILIADHFAQSKKSVLLVDANTENPHLAYHFEIHNLRQSITPTRFGISLFEISNIGALQHLSTVADQYDYIVIDQGQHRLCPTSGNRVGDQISLWIENSQSQKIVVSKNNDKSILAIRELAEGVRNTDAHSLLINLSTPLGRAKRKKLEEAIFIRTGLHPYLLSKDLRAITRVEEMRSTLSATQSKSIVKSEIERLALNIGPSVQKA